MKQSIFHFFNFQNLKISVIIVIIVGEKNPMLKNAVKIISAVNTLEILFFSFIDLPLNPIAWNII